MTLAGTEMRSVTMNSHWSLVCDFDNFIILEILLYSVCTVFGGYVKSLEVYFMIIYCYDISSLSCLTRFIDDPPHIMSTLNCLYIHKHCSKSTIFYGY